MEFYVLRIKIRMWWKLFHIKRIERDLEWKWKWKLEIKSYFFRIDWCKYIIQGIIISFVVNYLLKIWFIKRKINLENYRYIRRGLEKIWSIFIKRTFLDNKIKAPIIDLDF